MISRYPFKGAFERNSVNSVFGLAKAERWLTTNGVNWIFSVGGMVMALAENANVQGVDFLHAVGFAPSTAAWHLSGIDCSGVRLVAIPSFLAIAEVEGFSFVGLLEDFVGARGRGVRMSGAKRSPNRIEWVFFCEDI
jgi:hypothetical protein